jgi:hypothetical protein
VTQSGTDDDYEKMARHFIAYAGPFSVDVGNGTVTHRVDVSLSRTGKATTKSDVSTSRADG